LNEIDSDRCSRLPCTGARPDVALRHPPGHGLQPAQRTGDLGRQQSAGEQAQREHDHGDQAERELHVQHRLADG
jgi:hypothetical protein